jgi:transcriptional regulator with XRE-family HTH domain
MKFKDRVKELRQSKGWSQKEFSSQLGVAQSVIARYETGQKMASSDTLIDIAKLFGVSLDYLLGMSDERLIYDSRGNIKEPDLLYLTNLVRPRVNGVPVTDEQWKMITIFLQSVGSELEARGKIIKE